jgi:hypothetical protein
LPYVFDISGSYHSRLYDARHLGEESSMCLIQFAT